MSLYLDASVLIPTIVTEPDSATVDRFLEQTKSGLVVSDYAASEVASGVSRLVRMGRMTSDDAHMALADFDSWCSWATSSFPVEPQDVRVAGGFVRRFELILRTPDALHLALCARSASELVTLDRRLAEAASALDIPVKQLGP